MIKKAVKRPDEVEYIEFKGRENFEEVCRFIGSPEKLVQDINGNEYLLIRKFGDFEDVNISVGNIFYKWYDLEQDCKPWSMMDKDEFFKRYKED